MRYIFIFIFTFLFLSVLSQDKIGISNSNYSTTNSILLNPSASSDSKTFLQINWAGANAFVFTNQAFIPDFSVKQAFAGNIQYPQLASLKKKNFLYANASVDGPSAILSYKNIGAGFYSRARTIVDVRNIPYELGIAIAENDTVYLAQHLEVELKNVKASEMTWLEYGANFSIILHQHGTKLIAIGGNLKYLTGINIAYANLSTFKSQIVDTTLAIEKFKAKVRFTSPRWDRGRGVGLDLGITIKKTLEYVDAYSSHSPKYKCKVIDYKYKLALSLLDIGYIRFFRDTYTANMGGTAYIDRYMDESAIYDIFEPSFKENKPIWAILPSAASAQFDYNFNHHFYLNITAIQGLTTPNMVGVQRQNVISLTPRYERKQIEVAMPFSLQRYKYPQLGLAVRYRNIILGTDNIIPFIKENNTYGGGFYFNIGFALYKNPACRPKKLRTHRNATFWPRIEYKKEETKKQGNVDDSPQDDVPKVGEDKSLEKEKQKPAENDQRGKEIKTKKRYQWIFKRKSNRKEAKK